VADDWLDQIGIKVERRAIPAGATYVPASAHHRLGIHIGKSVNASCRCDGQRHNRIQSDGDIDIVPAGLDGEWEDDDDCSILRLWLSPTLLHGAAEDLGIDPARITLAPTFQHRDTRIEHIALALESQFDTSSRPGRLVAESLGKALAYQLICSRFQPKDVPAKQRLSLSQRRRLAEFIEGHLEHDLSLAELARVAGISVSHLKTLFRRSFGMPVHQYVIRRRVDRAKALIVSRELPLSEVALKTGFAHQSHMAHMMRRYLGVTPTSLSRAGW